MNIHNTSAPTNRYDFKLPNNRFYAFIILLISFPFSSFSQITYKDSIEKIVQRIRLPKTPDYQILITKFGAKGDSVSNAKPAFDKAMAECKKRKGGTIIVPKGVYTLNGPIHFVSNVKLVLEKGSKIRFSSNPEHYLPVVLTSWEGTMLYNYSPFIYAYQAENIAITGEGTIDGEASKTWAAWSDKQKDDQNLSRDMNHKAVPMNQRMFGKGHFLRPHLIQFFECKNILVENVQIEDSPFWCVHLLKCQSATLRGLKYKAFNKNNDGIDPEYSSDVLIENIDFDNSDDNVAIKAGRDNEGWTNASTPSQNIVVRNCRFKGLHAVVIGSEMSAGVRNVYVENCEASGYLKRGIYLKSNPDRGGYISNIYVNNIKFKDVEDCFFITSFYHNEGKGNGTDIHDIFISNISCEKASESGIVIQGFPSKKVYDVHLRNITIGSAKKPMTLTEAEKIDMADVVIGEKATAPSSVK
jgi:polygalacturonase